MNPYSDYGTIVVIPRFKGRNIELQKIRNRLLGENFGNLAIIGLPRIGKSSLAYNSLYYNRDELYNSNTYPLIMNLGKYYSFSEFILDFVSIVHELLADKSSIYKEKIVEFEMLVKFINDNISVRINRDRYLIRYLSALKSHNLRIIEIIDEFDASRRLLTTEDFQLLRQISYDPDYKIGLVTISRRTLKDLEPNDGSISNFYQVFQNLYLSTFSDEDLNDYWQLFDSSNVSIQDDTKSRIMHFTGGHPYLLDMFNYSFYERINGQRNVKIDDLLNETVEEFRVQILNNFDTLLQLLREENLDSKLLQLVVGPKYDISQSEVETLLRLGLVKSKGEGRYVGFSRHFDEYLHLLNINYDIWPIWSETERKLRKLISVYLIETFGENWVEAYLKKFPKYSEFINRLKITKEKQISSFKERASKDLLDSTYPSELYDYFMSKDWNWFGRIFGKSSDYYSHYFKHLSKFRNPIAHNYSEVLTESDRNLTLGYCRDILDKIKKWEHYPE